MSNLDATMRQTLEASPIAPASSPNIIETSEDVTILYIMLNTGLVVREDKNHFNSTLLDSYISEMNDFGNRPNQRLLDSFADYMTESGYKIRRDRLAVKPASQRVVSWEHPIAVGHYHHCQVLLSSNPVAGESYLDATVYQSTTKNQFKFSFVAQSPQIIFQKLKNFGLVDPNKKGGSYA